jgi:transposase-like protein
MDGGSTIPIVALKPAQHRAWEAKLTPALAEELHRRRKGKVGRSWCIDETYIRVHGRWRYLYRATDRDGDLVDVMFSEHCNFAAAKCFLRSAKAVAGVIPDRVTTGGHDAYPRAIRPELGSRVWHQTNSYLNNCLEGDHHCVKGRCRSMLGFKSVPSARRYCRGHDELPNFLRSRSRRCTAPSLYAPDSHHRSVFWRPREQKLGEPKGVGFPIQALKPTEPRRAAADLRRQPYLHPSTARNR